MPVSLSPPLPPAEYPLPLELAVDEAGAIPFLKKDRHLLLKFRGDEISKELNKELLSSGFEEIPSNVSPMIDLKAYSDLETYLKSLKVKFYTDIVRRSVRVLEKKGEWEIRPCAEMSLDEHAKIYREVILPFCSARGVHPFYVNKSEMYVRVVDRLTHQRYSAITLKIGGRYAAVMYVQKTGAREYFGEQDCRLERDYAWVRPVDPAETFCNANLFAVHPSVDPDVDPFLTSAMYRRTIQWCFDEGCTAFALGFEDRKRLINEQYLGVIRYKRHWNGSSALLWSGKTRFYLRYSRESVLSQAADSGYFHGTQSAPKVTYFFTSAISTAEIRRVLASDTHLTKYVYVDSGKRRAEIAVLLASSPVPNVNVLDEWLHV